MTPLLSGPVNALLIELLRLAIVAAIGVSAPPLLRWWRAHTTAQERAILAGVAGDAVLWAEQFAAGPGALKFRAAVDQVNRVLGHAGLSLAAVEAAVQAAWASAKADGLLNPPTAAPTPTESAPPAPALAPAPDAPKGGA